VLSGEYVQGFQLPGLLPADCRSSGCGVFVVGWELLISPITSPHNRINHHHKTPHDNQIRPACTRLVVALEVVGKDRMVESGRRTEVSEGCWCKDGVLLRTFLSPPP